MLRFQVLGPNATDLLRHLPASKRRFKKVFRAEEGNVEIWVGKTVYWMSSNSIGVVIIKEDLDMDRCLLIILRLGGERFNEDIEGNYFEIQLFFEIEKVCIENYWQIVNIE